jgi:hypothetical protein
MPARSERIHIVPAQSGAPAWTFGFPRWWDRGAFFAAFQARELDLGNPVDANLAWLLSAAEAVAWDEGRRRDFSRDPRSADPAVQEEMRRLAAALDRASWIVVESYEWESGLD